MRSVGMPPDELSGPVMSAAEVEELERGFAGTPQQGAAAAAAGGAAEGVSAAAAAAKEGRAGGAAPSAGKAFIAAAGGAPAAAPTKEGLVAAGATGAAVGRSVSALSTKPQAGRLPGGGSSPEAQPFKRMALAAEEGGRRRGVPPHMVLAALLEGPQRGEAVVGGRRSEVPTRMAQAAAGVGLSVRAGSSVTGRSAAVGLLAAGLAVGRPPRVRAGPEGPLVRTGLLARAGPSARPAGPSAVAEVTAVAGGGGGAGGSNAPLPSPSSPSLPSPRPLKYDGVPATLGGVAVYRGWKHEREGTW